MKKIFVVMMLIIVASLGFSQTLSGSIESGMNISNSSGSWKIQNFSWNSGGNGYAKLGLNIEKGASSVSFKVYSSDSNTLFVDALWFTTKMKNVVLNVGKIDNGLFLLPYNGMADLDGQGVRTYYNGKNLKAGVLVPLNNVAQPLASVQEFKVAGQVDYAGFTIMGVYENKPTPIYDAGVYYANGGLWTGFETHITGGVAILSPFIDYTAKSGKWELTLDSFTDTINIVKDNETALWVNYWIIPEFRLLGRVIYNFGGDFFKTREGFRVNFTPDSYLRVQLDTNWTAAPVHTINAFVVKSF